jgi:hypothetical protein
MNNYYVEETEFTPEISFNLDTKKFTFKGVSRPEDVFKYYLPTIAWLKKFDEEAQIHTNTKYEIPNINVEFHLSYFNSASSKMILQIIELMKRIQNNGIIFSIDWYYDACDEQMYDDGVDLSETIEMPFNFIKYS